MNWWCDMVEASAGGVKWWRLELVARWRGLELVVRGCGGLSWCCEVMDA